MKKRNERTVLSEFENSANLLPSVQIEQALSDIQDTFMVSSLAQIPFTEIAALGGAFSNLIQTLITPAGKGIYRCVFPEGVSGTLAVAKDGSGAFGTIMDGNEIVGQARWIPVEKNIGPACVKAVLVAVAVLAVVKQINDIKDGQKEIIGILERDKKSQLIADYDILSAYMEEYKYYWENDATVIVNLNQVKDIKRNAQKDIRSYAEQINDLIGAKKNILKLQSFSQKIGKLLDRFVRYKLALHVWVLSEYMEVMLSKNFQSEYLNKVSNDIRNNAAEFRELYSKCYDKIELLKTEAISTQMANTASKTAKFVGGIIGKIPVIKNGYVDEFLLGLGDSIDDSEKKQLEKILSFFIQYKDSGLIPVAEHIDMINQLSNTPVVMLYDKNILCIKELKEAS